MSKDKKTNPTATVVDQPREPQHINKDDVGSFPVQPVDRPPLDMVPVDMMPAALPEAAQAFLEEAKGPVPAPSRVPLVGINHKEGGFVMPSGEIVPEISGYPIQYFHTRRFYKKPPQAGQKGQPPDCWSSDCVEPHQSSLEPQSETCASCKNSQFQTGRDGRSQACGMYTWVFLFNPQFGTPPVLGVSFPPSSIRTLIGTRFQSGYFAQAAAKHGGGKVFCHVWTTLRLKQMGDQVIYCEADPVMGPPQTDVTKVKFIAKIRNEFLALMDQMRLKTPDVEASGQE
jgi:hypothetical protein